MELNLKNTGETGYIKHLSLLFFLPPFFFIGAFFPMQRFIWLALLCATFFTLPFLYVMSHAFTPSAPSLVFRILASVFCLIIGIAVLYGFSDFVYSCVLPDTNPLIIPSFLSLLAYYLSLQGLIPVEKFSRMSGLFIIILFLISILSTITKIDLFFMPFSFSDYFPTSNLNNRKSFWELTLIAWFILIIQCFILTVAFSETNKTSVIFKEMTKGLFTGGLLLAASYLAGVAVLGPNVLEALIYPLYYPPGLTGRAEYMERTEGVLLTIFTFSCFMHTSMLFISIRRLFS